MTASVVASTSDERKNETKEFQMNTQLFIVPQLLEGVGPINAAAKKMAEQTGSGVSFHAFDGRDSERYFRGNIQVQS
jgi:hypothetical protein